VPRPCGEPQCSNEFIVDGKFLHTLLAQSFDLPKRCATCRGERRARKIAPAPQKHKYKEYKQPRIRITITPPARQPRGADRPDRTDRPKPKGAAATVPKAGGLLRTSTRPRSEHDLP